LEGMNGTSKAFESAENTLYLESYRKQHVQNH